MALLDFLKLPEAKGIESLDAPETTLLHRRIIQSKPFLKKLYLEFYAYFLKKVPALAEQKCVELGSGGGFLKEIYPTVITSDVLKLSGVDLCFSGLDMPFESASIDAFFMIDVFHHVPDSERFLKELSRCLKPGGQVVMIEPANTLFGRFIYQNFHHEAFEPSAGWKLEGSGPLSCANGALPWIVFSRDRAKFEKMFPEFKLVTFKPHTPFRYLLSGGVSMRQLLPDFTYPAIALLDHALNPVNHLLGMFYKISLTKN